MRWRRGALTAATALIAASIIVPLWLALVHGKAVASTTHVVTHAQQSPTPVTIATASGLQVLHADTHFTYAPPAHAPAFPPIAASAGILIDLDTHTILWQSNEHQPLPPASTTKILTALVAMENFPASRPVTISSDALTQAWDETRMGLAANQTLTVRELTYGMLMVSANDAATALAVDTVGMNKFVEGMNAQVSALGLHDSHFVQPVGLDDPGEKASAYDLAVIATTEYDTFPLFRDVVGTQYRVLPASATHPEYDLGNINLLLTTYPGVLGVKPGYTGDAGYCLVAMASRNGHRLISVLLNAPLVYHQSAQLLDWGFQTDGVPSALPSPKPPAK